MLNLGFYLLVILLVYSFYLVLVRFIKNKKLNINNFEYSLIVSTFQFATLLALQETEYIMYLGAIFITFLFLFCINIGLSNTKLYKIFLTIFSSILFIYGTIQRYIIMFRGAPFTIADLSAIRTALSVSSGYDYTPTKGIVIGFVIFILNMVFILKISFIKINLKKYLLIFGSCFLLLAVIFTSFSLDRKNIEKLGSVNLFNPVGTFSDYGSLLNVYINYIYSTFNYPEDYNPDKVLETLDNLSLEKETQGPKAVNVICILEESFFDLSLVKDIKASEDYLAYYHSLDENTIKGYTVVSAFGGGTANSEFEFLTNGNMAFLADSSYPFSKYINKDTYSITSVLKNLGYNTIAYHPYLKESWNRQNVYPLLGFDTYYDYVDRFNEDTEKSLLRGLLSDKADFKELIKIYNEKDEGSNLFLYNVTIQNHSGYGDYPEINQVVDSTYNNQELNTYLTLIKESDNAIKELIEYFDKIDEPTLICIFGDHIPGTLLDIEENNSGALQDKLNYYRTPFLIHTNYDIDEKYYENISLSYLSTLVMDYANLPKTKEQTFVQSFMNDYPIINKFAYGNKNNLEATDKLTENLKLWRDFTNMNFSFKE